MHQVADHQVVDRPEHLHGDLLRAALVRGNDIHNVPPPSPLVAGILDLDALALLYGPSGHMKSFVAQSLALSVATKTWWFGHKVEPGPVLYIVAEGLSGVGIRADAWQVKNRVWGCGDLYWLPMAVNLLDAKWRDGLEHLVADLKPVLIVIDTLARCMTGGDENSAKDMGRVVEAAEGLRRPSGACVLLVHHTGK